jgi:hypothetical protein
MQTTQIRVQRPPTADDLATVTAAGPQLVLVFASVEILADPATATVLQAAFPDAEVVGCSTAGEISDAGVSDDSCVVTGVRFDDPTCLEVAVAELGDMASSVVTGAELGGRLAADDLHAVIVLSQGVEVNGSALIDGIRAAVGPDVVVTGGLAGDAGAFERTVTYRNGDVGDRAVIGIGLRGDVVRVAHGSFGGWSTFGPTRKVTRSDGNVLHELDGKPALEVYKSYLGDYAADLPASGLLFPFALLHDATSESGIIRTLLGVDETAGSLTMAGDVPEGGYVKLMHADTDGLVAGAERAAEACAQMLAGRTDDTSRDGLTLLVSCIGRKLVMGDMVDEEVEAVGDVFAHASTLAGFYSYGEISPLVASTDCRLHNQTMTITHVSER